MKIIAISWSSRTGKTTAIAMLKEIFEQQGKNVKVFWETAQPYIDNNSWPITDRYAFERFIMEEEIKRLSEIQTIKEKNEYDILLTDRTFLDAFIYIYRAILHGTIKNPDILGHTEEIALSKELYDVVIFFDTMITPDKNFSDYNKEDINALFKHSMQSVYGEKLIHYPNNKEFKKDIDMFLKKYMQ